MLVYSCTGALRQYLFYASAFWWLFCFGNLWWIMVFTTKGNLLFENARRIHVIQSVVAWGVPIIGVTVVAANVRYSQSLIFPHVCYTASVPVFYYLLVLPEQLFVGSACTLLIWTCYSLAKQVTSVCWFLFVFCIRE